MSMKVYQNGVNVVIERPSDPKKKVIPTEQTRFSFLGGSTQIQDIVSNQTYTAETVTVQDQAGTPIGNETLVCDYLSAFIGA